MKRSTALTIVRLACIVAMGFSVALIVDATRVAPAFCALGSGCDTVRKSGYSSVAGIPVSYIGLLAYAIVFVLAMSKDSAKQWGARLAALGGLVALGLLCLQAFVIHAFCTLCLGVDTSAVIAGAAGAYLLTTRARANDEPLHEVLPGSTWAALVLAALFGPIAASTMAPNTSAPNDIRAFWKPGVVNIVELSDFECPFCRINHPELEKAKKASKTPVHFVRVSMPLPSHPNARPATRAYLCAVEQGKGEEMADALFIADPPSEANAAAAAERLGLDLARFKSCVVDAKTDAKIDADIAMIRRTDFKGLPTTWINDQKLLGAKPTTEIAAAIEAASQGEASGRGPGIFLGFLAFIAGLLGMSLRRGLPSAPRPAASSEPPSADPKRGDHDEDA